MPDRKKNLVGSSYYNVSYFNQYNPELQNETKYLLNTILSTTLSMFDWFENRLFPNDGSRVVYAKNEYAFRARMETQRGSDNTELQANTMNMPFLNFGLTGVDMSSQRLISPYAAKKDGVFVEELGKKFRFFPVKLTYEGCFFTTQMTDAHVVLAKLFKTASLQIITTPKLYYAGNAMDNFAELHFTDIKLDGEYTEKDWLEKNRIHTVAFTIGVDTFMVDTDPGVDAESTNTSFCIPKELILNWAIRNNLDLWDGFPQGDWDGQEKFVIDHVNHRVYPEWEDTEEDS